MDICVIGSGYVGLVVGICMADLGNNVIGVDIDKKKIDMLNKGELPIYEPGLTDLLKRNLREKRINFTNDLKKGIDESTIIFIAVGTPQGNDDLKADLSIVFNVTKEIGKYMNDYKIIINKSTVPVGSGEEIKKIIKANQKKPIDFDIVSNPEFLREGEAVNDFLIPDRIVIGTDSEKAREMMENLYKGIARTDHPILFCDIKSAELIKYSSNAMLATRISFMNMLSRLCETTGADIKVIAKGMGLDKRIGTRFLQAGIGYGGSCFPKDIKALISTLDENGCTAEILRAVEDVNETQKFHIIPKIEKLIPDLNGKKIAVWGLAFKPKTDDMREAPTIKIIEELYKKGAKINAFDPEAQENAKIVFKNIDIKYFKSPLEALDGCDCLVIATEWNIFRNIDKQKIKSLLKEPNVIDGRNIYEPNEMKDLGFNYIGVGRK